MKSAKTSKRIFVALDLADAARNRIEQFTSNIKRDFSHLRVGWEKPEKLHLTLKFLGDIDESRLSDLQNAIDKTAKNSKPFLLTLEKTGCFPSAQKAKILWIGLDDKSGALGRLNRTLEENAAKYGFEKESRSFKPHLTIARLRDPEKSRELVEAFLQKQIEPVAFEVSQIVIYESELQPTGSIYSVVLKHDLTSSQPDISQ